MLRQRGEQAQRFFDITHELRRVSDDVVVGNYPARASYFIDNREIIWWDASKRSGKFKRTRACDHLVVKRSVFPKVDTYYENDTHHKYFYTSWKYAPWVEHRPNLDSLSGVHAEALQFFKSGCVEQELDLVTNLIELRQVTNTFSFLQRRITNLLDAAKVVSGGHLAWSFGVKPLMSDVKSLSQSLTGIADKISWLRKNQGKPVKVLFRKDVTELTKPADQSKMWSVGPLTSGYPTWKATYTAYAVLIYDTAKLHDWELTARILCRQFGADNVLGILWENIPFSFVLDWVLKVGDFLDALAPKVSIPFKFLDVGYTIKVVATYETALKYKRPYRMPAKRVYHQDAVRYFRRGVGLPVGIPSLATGDPGLNQLALALSLFVQKLKA